MRGLIVDPYESGLAELYHFTASHLLPLIQRDGLTRGVIPSIQGKTLLGFIDQAQRLTSNADFDQSWQRQSSLPSLSSPAWSASLAMVPPASSAIKTIALNDNSHQKY